MSNLNDNVVALMREVAAREIMPRFRALADSDIEEKSKGDLVTIADRASELWLTPRLEALVAGSHVLGEEAAAADPALLDRLSDDKALWTVDPVDGTGNFVAGRETFGVMVSLVEKGETTHAWIYLPVADEFAIAERGAGAFWMSGGETGRLMSGRAAPATADQSASFYVRFMPDEWRAGIEKHAEGIGRRESTLCSAVDYTSVARGRHDFVTYYRMLPWDHVPGTLILREAGGVVRDIETGLDYSPRTLKGPHLVARDEESWQSTAESIRALRAHL
ncbi:inositol monophosphatase family protein [Parvibaculum sp.]|uniref:inositol monophosphatase family protein n=1 Tax=Parvibaculum sp. TaxID=2024848 RepID=UPI001D5B4414|nr:inositol monophosphatase family protein [Parvibaculum sp.]MBX3487842.1 inositol monophosphatase [Parvibaculum sp.]MCW5728166.1 inositol monophosphatase [Parvibaculum sp.]